VEAKYYQRGYRGRSPSIKNQEGHHLIIYSPQLQDPSNNVIAFIQPTRPTRYQGIGDVYAELHFVRSAGAPVVVCPVDISETSLTTCRMQQMDPPLMDTVTVTAMLYRFVSTCTLNERIDFYK
jgi:hypothetical protein